MQYDDTFLELLNKARLRVQYSKITLLSFDEVPITTIGGQITTGNISVNGSSAIRRTLTLTMLVDDTNAKIENIENEISINKKIKVQIGLKNPFPKYMDQYGDIIWFPQGIFVLSSINSNRSTSGWTLSITAKDKMALLDGSAGGTFPATAVLHERYIELKNGDVKIEHPLIREIIFEAVNHYGGEDASRIVINDLDDEVKMLVKYDGFSTIYRRGDSTTRSCSFSFTSPTGNNDKAVEVLPGDDVGYKMTDFTYPGELILNAGDTVVTLLDKIVKILGNYEYYYDLDGNFIFQQIKNYINTQSPLEELQLSNLAASDYMRIYDNEKIIYSFTDFNSTSAITHSPKIDNLKNDFYVWGQKSENLAIRYHLSIDAKPEGDFALKTMCPVYDDDTGEIIDYIFITSKFAVLLAQAGTTIYEYDGVNNIVKDEFEVLQQDRYFQISSYNKNRFLLNDRTLYINRNQEGNKFIIRPPIPNGLVPLYTNYQTTREAIIKEKEKNKETYTEEQIDSLTREALGIKHEYPLHAYEWREELYRQALYAKTKTGFDSGNNYYYEELLTEWRDIYDPSLDNPWKMNPDTHPEDLKFWLDFIDTGADIGKYSVRQIGRRTKVVNNTNLKTIYNKEVPDVVFIPSDAKNKQELQTKYSRNGQTWCALNSYLWDMFSISTTGASCFDEIRDLMYHHLNYNTTIQITCMPIYYLEPNRLIYVEDVKSGIIGNFQITQFSLPLTYNGTMSISATEVFTKV